MGANPAPVSVTVEGDHLRALTAAAREGGWFYHHTQRSDYGRQMGMRGFPDLFLVHAVTGKMIALEVKGDRGIVSPEQGAWLDALRAAGAVTAVVWPADVPKWVARLRAAQRA